MIWNILIIFIAGWGAGMVTGMVGASAVVIITPLLTTFLGYTPYAAIGISLATDVVASSASSFTYFKNNNLRLKEGVYLGIASVTAAIVGSWLSKRIPAPFLGGSTGVIIIFMGLALIQKPLNERIKDFQEKFDLSFWKDKKIASALFFGGLIGLMTGFFGAGGGMMILLVLTFIYGFSVHAAVGTSVLIMTFNALSGGISHFFVAQHLPLFEILISGIAGFIGAFMAARYANEISEEMLSDSVGIIFTLLGVISLMWG